MSPPARQKPKVQQNFGHQMLVLAAATLQRLAHDMKRKLNADDVPEGVVEGSQEELASPEATFASLGLDPRLVQAANRDKFAAPTQIQKQAIPAILHGKDVLGMYRAEKKIGYSH